MNSPKLLAINEEEHRPLGASHSGITFQTHNLCYRLAEYTTPEGLTIVGQLPGGFQGGSFGKSPHCLYSLSIPSQHVTQLLLLKQIRDLDAQHKGENGYYTHIGNDFLPSLAVQILCLYFQKLNHKNVIAASTIFKG